MNEIQIKSKTNLFGLKQVLSLIITFLKLIEQNNNIK